MVDTLTFFSLKRLRLRTNISVRKNTFLLRFLLTFAHNLNSQISVMKLMRLPLLAIALTALVASCHSNKPKEISKADIVLENILNRKSVRSFTNQKLSQGQIDTLLRAGMAAPSGMNIQPWSFVVLQDARRYDSIFGDKNYNLPMFKKSAAIIVVCGDTTVTYTPREGEEPVTVPNEMWRDDLGAVTENILLAAEAMGLGAVWTVSYPYENNYVPVKNALGLPPTVLPYSAVALGYPDGDNEPKDKWNPLRIHYENW